MSDRPIFIDIDGTLTDHPQQGGRVIPERIDQVNKMLEDGRQIVIWSGGGTGYVHAFCAQHKIIGAVMIGKPECCVDDNPLIRPAGRMPIHPPDTFFS